LNTYFKYAFELLKQKGVKTVTNPAKAIEEFIETKKYQQNQALLDQMNFTEQDLAKNNSVLDHFKNLGKFDPKTINWFLPTFEHAYGGVYTILRFAEYFQTVKKMQNTFIICGSKTDSMDNIKEAITKVFPTLASSNIIMLNDSNSEDLPEADISIATYWTTAYILLKFNKTKGKFYFIQDYEPLFFPAGFIYGLTEATYHFGFHAIINTPGLHQEYTTKHAGTAEYFTPSIDNKVFYPPNKPPQSEPFKIFFYGRPTNPRNGFELGIAALKRIKKQYKEKVNIYTAGSKWNQKIYDPENNITNLGMLPYEKTGDLYRSCNLGIAFMFTKHPSYLPFELMACGCPVLTNRNAATTWMLKDNQNCALTEPTVSSISERIRFLIENPDLLQKLSINGIKTVEQTNWQTEIEKIYLFIRNNKQVENE
jgi:O-antigen biosynthesis protein